MVTKKRTPRYQITLDFDNPGSVKPLERPKSDTELKVPVQETPLTSYPREEVFEKTIAYFNGDSLAANVWINKYALKDSGGNIYERTPNDMHWRMARELARIEKKYPNPVSGEELYKLLKGFKYIVPQGGPMSGIGNNFQYASLSNCFVIGPGDHSDSYGSIIDP